MKVHEIRKGSHFKPLLRLDGLPAKIEKCCGAYEKWKIQLKFTIKMNPIDQNEVSYIST